MASLNSFSFFSCSSVCWFWSWRIGTCNLTAGVARKQTWTNFVDDWLYWFDDCSDCRRGPDGQAGAEEGSHRPADGQAQVQEESSEAPRLRQPVGRHRDEGAGGLWDQQVGGLNDVDQLNPFVFGFHRVFYYAWLFLLLFMNVCITTWSVYTQFSDLWGDVMCMLSCQQVRWPQEAMRRVGYHGKMFRQLLNCANSSRSGSVQHTLN